MRVTSVQSIIDQDMGGSCLGGDASEMYELNKTLRIPLETCNIYKSHNPAQFSQDQSKLCHFFDHNNEQRFIKDYVYFQTKNWQRVQGVEQMKLALRDGPIACSIQVIDSFLGY